MQRLACLILVIGCATPFEVQDAEPFTPPAIFADYWAEMEACSGISGDMRRVTWYDTHDGFIGPNGDLEAGWWVAPHTIFLARMYETQQPAYWARLVKHEMLHDLLGRTGHPPIFVACGVPA